MTTARDDIDQILASDYLSGMAERSLADIRRMRTECQEVEAGLSFLRRMIQGRLDIVAARLEHLDAETPMDLGVLVDELPSILTPDQGASSGSGQQALLVSPDTEKAGLTAELDAILGADEIGALAEMDLEQLSDISARLEVLERSVSADRSALHQRIDSLQAELVDRYKTGRASTDELLA